MDYFSKTYNTPGTAPGTLIETSAEGRSPLRISVIGYSDRDIFERELTSAQEFQHTLSSQSITWIHLQGYSDAENLHKLGETFGLHSLALEDVLHTGQRPKLDIYEDSLFVSLNLPYLKEDALCIEQVSLFVGAGFVLSFVPGDYDPFDPVRTRLRQHQGHLRARGPDFLAHALIDLVVDSAFPLLDQFSDAIEKLEEDVLENSSTKTLNAIHSARRDLMLLRRSLHPQREVLNGILRDQSSLIHAESYPFFRDCYDHTVHLIDLIETYRELSASLLEVYLSTVNNRMSEVMRLLTVIATIFIPLTFIVGVYGMNFGSNTASPWAMPELNWYYGYPAVWALMAAMVVLMLWYFRRKNWF